MLLSQRDDLGQTFGLDRANKALRVGPESGWSAPVRPNGKNVRYRRRKESLLNILFPASPSTWYRLVRTAGWRRPRIRVYPAKPKIGIRAKAPGELLHLDVTIIRLLDGTRAYLHAVIDNYSRRILSWTLEERLGSGGTCRILRKAVAQLNDCPDHTIVVADSGSENVSGAVDNVLDDEEWTRVLAQVEITFSNSMIEAFWRSLKHGWLYLHTLGQPCFPSSPHRVLRHRSQRSDAPFGIPGTNSRRRILRHRR